MNRVEVTNQVSAATWIKLERVRLILEDEVMRFCVFTWLMLGSLVSSIWKTGGGRVCCSTCNSC